MYDVIPILIEVPNSSGERNMLVLYTPHSAHFRAHCSWALMLNQVSLLALYCNILQTTCGLGERLQLAHWWITSPTSVVEVLLWNCTIKFQSNQKNWICRHVVIMSWRLLTTPLSTSISFSKHFCFFHAVFLLSIYSYFNFVLPGLFFPLLLSSLKF